MKAIFLLDDKTYNWIYGEEERKEICELLEIVCPQLNGSNLFNSNQAVLRDVEAIISGWGMIKMDQKVLDLFPNLKIIFYGAGTIKNFVTEEMWDRGIRVVSAWAANAVPVAEFTFAEIILSLKGFWHSSTSYKASKGKRDFQMPFGAYGSTVGLISLGMIGRLVLEKLKTLDVNVIAYDPFVSPEQGRNMGCEMTSLEELFRRADVVSCHTPWLKETEKMLKAEHFRLLKPNAVFINTARGAVVDENAMIEVLKERPDLYAVLDVTYPEPPEKNSPLYELPNVVLSPHIAGSMGNECKRMGRYMVDEIKRFLNGEKLKYEISKQMSKTLA